MNSLYNNSQFSQTICSLFIVFIIIGVIVLLMCKHRRKKRENYFYPTSKNINAPHNFNIDLYSDMYNLPNNTPLTDTEINAINPYSSLLINSYNSMPIQMNAVEPVLYKKMDDSSLTLFKKTLNKENFTDENIFDYPDVPLYMQVEKMDSQTANEMSMRASPLSDSYYKLLSEARRHETKAEEGNVSPLEKEKLLQHATNLRKKANEIKQNAGANNINYSTQGTKRTFNIERQSEKIGEAMMDIAGVSY